MTDITDFFLKKSYDIYMITLVRQGDYSLIETKGQIKILTLDKQMFAWIHIADIGEMLVTSYNFHKTEHLLAAGHYRLYLVKDEPKLTDLMHLELFVGNGAWQGYLLPKGLPTEKERRHRIIPTKEIITRSIDLHYYKKNLS